MKETLKYGLILTIVCMVAGGFLSGVNRMTKPLITVRSDEEKGASLKEVMPQAADFEAVRDGDTTLYYRAYDKNKNIIGAAFIASAKGYSSTIETMAGMLNDGTITSIKILQQNETPGLGTKIEEVEGDTTIFDAFAGKRVAAPRKAWFQQQFSGKRPGELTAVDAISGATISSKAVIDSVKGKAEEVRNLIRN